jgi:iron(III) transport system permease protein
LALEQFTIPGYLGAHIRYTTLSYNIYLRTNAFPADLPGAAAGGTILLLLSSAGLYMYRRMTKMAGKFTTITARGYKPAVIDLGRMRHVLLAFCIATVFVECLIPLGAVLMRAFMRVRTIGIDFSVINLENFNELFSISYFSQGLKNSLVLGFTSAAFIVALGMLLSVWIVRRKSRPIALTDYLIAMPIAIPGTVFGVGMLWAYIRTPLYMTLSILLLSYVVRYAVYGVRMFSAGLMQTDKALEEAARISGASPLRAFLRIDLPLMRPIVGSCMLITFLAVMRELSASVILYGATTTTLPILTWNMLNEGYYGTASCLAVVQVGIVGLVVVIAQYAFGISVVDRVMKKKETDEG